MEENSRMSRTWKEDRLPDIGENSSKYTSQRACDSANGKLEGVAMKGSSAPRRKPRKPKSQRSSGSGRNSRQRSTSRDRQGSGGTPGFASPIALDLASPPESRAEDGLSPKHSPQPFTPSDLSQAFTRHSSRASQRTTLAGIDTEIDHLYSQHVSYSNRITNQGRKLQLVERALAELEEQLTVQRAESKKPMKNFIRDQKRFKRLEARLQHVTSNLSTVEHERETLREKVNSLRMEKMGLRTTHDALSRDLRRKVKDLDSLKQDTSRLQSQQQQRMSEMNEIKARAVIQVQEFKEAFEERKKAVLLDNAGLCGFELSDRDSLTVGARSRETSGLHAFITTARCSKKGSPGRKKAPDEDLSQTLGSLDHSMEHKDDVLKHRIDDVAESVNQIMSATGVTGVDEFVETMNDAETRHYNWFKIISDLNKDHEELETEKTHLFQQIEKAGQKENDSEERKAKLKDLELQVTQIRTKTEAHEALYDEESAVLDGLRETILHIFYMLGCGENPQGANLKAQGFYPDNALQFLALIEQRLDVILQVQTIQKGQGASFVGVFSQGREATPPPSSTPPVVPHQLPGSGRASVRPSRTLPHNSPQGHGQFAFPDVDDDEPDHIMGLSELQELVSKEFSQAPATRLNTTGKSVLMASTRFSSNRK